MFRASTSSYLLCNHELAGSNWTYQAPSKTPIHQHCPWQLTNNPIDLILSVCIHPLCILNPKTIVFIVLQYMASVWASAVRCMGKFWPPYLVTWPHPDAICWPIRPANGRRICYPTPTSRPPDQGACLGSWCWPCDSTNWTLCFSFNSSGEGTHINTDRK
jgi:hypothetical protein